MVQIQLIVKLYNKTLKVKIANVSFTDIESNYTNSLKHNVNQFRSRYILSFNKKLKENNDYVVVNVDWGYLMNEM